MIRVACEEQFPPKVFRDDPSKTLGIAREMLSALRSGLLEEKHVNYGGKMTITILVRCDSFDPSLDS